MSWWNIIKISEDARKKMMERYSGRKRTARQTFNQSKKGKKTTGQYADCQMCGQRKTLRNIKYYPPMKKLCNSCAKFKFGEGWQSKGEKIE